MGPFIGSNMKYMFHVKWQKRTSYLFSELEYLSFCSENKILVIHKDKL
jgi:hypothetical protein